LKYKNDNAHDGPVFTDEEPRIIGDIMLDNPALAAVLVKALQQRIETLEAQVEHIEDFGVCIRTAERIEDRIAVLQEENRNIIRTLERLRWGLVDCPCDIDLT
tara:strand:+ start:2239 stop:2547 length:309 start_codon:yes stop_codon:yes gene_type:complete